MKALPILLVLLLSTTAFADRNKEFKKNHSGRRGNERSERVTELQVADPLYNGNGCPDGTMRVAFSPDNLSFSILFDKFVAEIAADGRRVREKDRMACSVVVPMMIPEGMQMSVTRVDYRGFANLSANSRGLLQSRISFFERDRNRFGDGRAKDTTQIRYEFKGPTSEDYMISTDALDDNNPAPTVYKSPCGGAVRLRIDNSLTIVSRSPEDAMVTLDSIDGSSNAVYFVNWERCVDNSPDHGPRPGGPRFPRGMRNDFGNGGFNNGDFNGGRFDRNSFRRIPGNNH